MSDSLVGLAFANLNESLYPGLGLGASVLATLLGLLARTGSDDVTGWASAWAERHFPWTGQRRRPGHGDTTGVAGASETVQTGREADFVASHLPEVVIRGSLLLKNERSRRSPPLSVSVEKCNAPWHHTDSVAVLHSPGEVVRGTQPVDDGDRVRIEVPGGLPPRSVWSVEVRSTGGDVRFSAAVGGAPISVRTREAVLDAELPRSRGRTQRLLLLGVASVSAFAWGILLQRLVEAAGVGWPAYGWSLVFVIVYGLTWLANATLIHPPPTIGRGYLGWGIPGRWPTRTLIPARSVARRPFIIHSKGSSPSVERSPTGATDPLHWLRLAVGASEWLGVSPIVDVGSFPAGTSLGSAMADAVAESDVVVFLATDASLSSDYCHREINEALHAGRRVATLICGNISKDVSVATGSRRGSAYLAEVKARALGEPSPTGTEDFDLYYPVSTDEQMYAAMVAVLTIPLHKPDTGVRFGAHRPAPSGG